MKGVAPMTLTRGLISSKSPKPKLPTSFAPLNKSFRDRFAEKSPDGGRATKVAYPRGYTKRGPMPADGLFAAKRIPALLERAEPLVRLALSPRARPLKSDQREHRMSAKFLEQDERPRYFSSDEDRAE
jgi:hypothetical protein